MFYLNEIFLRIKFSLFTFLITLVICFYYKEVLLILFSIPILNLPLDISLEFNNLIYTHPFELFKIHFFFAFIITIYLFIPYFFWHILDFLKSSLPNYKYKLLLKYNINIISIVLCTNYFFYYYFLPNIWFFLKNFNISNNLNKILKFYLELRVEEYFYFIFDFLYLTNILILLFLFFFSIIILFGLSNMILWKKLFIFINIMCATLLSPPDVYSQLLILFLLSFIFEGIIFINLYIYKLYIYIFKNKT